MNKMSVKDLKNLKGKKVLVRCDFNVPMKDGVITDENRIMGALPTIQYLLDAGARVTLCSHMGKPHSIFSSEVKLNKKDKKKVDAGETTAEAIIEKAKKDEPKKLTLAPVAKRLAELTGGKVIFATDVIGEDANAKRKALKNGEAVLLENLRFHWEEEKKDEAFCKALAYNAEIYVNDAFGTAHRKHASTYLIAKYFPNDKMFGYLMEREVKAIAAVMENPARPFCAIIGGSKVSSKIGVIKALIEKCDSIVIGGGMTYTFAAAQGGKVGKSICEPDMFPVALEILELAKQKGVKLVMSPDALIADDFSQNANTKTAPANNIPDGWEGVDIADEGKKAFREHILGCKTILWNGPVGVFEIDKFATGSKEVALAIAEATKNGAYSLIGGGDSVACVNKFGLADQVSYISTGGGALLEYIEFGDLPGVAAIRD